MKRLLALLLFLSLAVFTGGCDLTDYTDDSIQLRNGEVYEYFQHDSYAGGDFHGLRFDSATRAQIMIFLDPLEEADSNHPIKTAKDAAYYGASALDSHIRNWTMVDTVGVVHNPEANLWLVHGMFYDRNTPGEAWAVVLDAETGKVLGFSELDGDT